MTYVRLHPAWEICSLKSGGFVLHSIYGEVVRITTLEALAVEMFQALASGRTADTEILDGLSRKRVEAMIENGLLIPDGAEAAAIPAELRARFDPVADIFVQFGATDPGIRAKRFNALRQARVGIVGAGGVGSQLAIMLAATGIGFLRVIDGDTPEEKNLTRQLFYTMEDVRQQTPKVMALKSRISALTPHTSVDPCISMIDSPISAQRLLVELDIVVVTADQPRILLQRWINEACAKLRTPAIFTFVDRVGPLFLPGHSACFACLETKWRSEIGEAYDEIVAGLDPHRPARFPSLVAGPSVAANTLFLEIMSLLTGMWPLATCNAMLMYQYPEFSRILVPRDEACPICSEH